MSVAADHLWGVIEPYLSAERIELDDVELIGRGRGRVLRVTVDAEGGIDLDTITRVSRGLSRLLDEEDEVPGPFSLEVTSPGLERKLRRPAHYAKALGREVVVKTTSGETHRGTLAQIDGDRITVESGDQDHQLTLADVAQARTVFRYEPSPKPGKSRAAKRG